MADTFHMDCIEIFCNELPAEAKLFSPLTGSVEDLIPPVGLKNGNIILLFIFRDFLSHLHPLTQDLH